MRSDEIDSSSHIILGFGDSVINGGVLTDQDSLATGLLSKELSILYGHNVQFLNISAGSWGPDNCYAYLQKHGDFNAKSIYLVVSSHDAYDNMNFEEIVDIHKSFQSRQYKFAIWELFDRYAVSRIDNLINNQKIPESESLGINKKKEDSEFNTGFSSFFEYSKAKKIPLTIYLHAEKEEFEAEKYNEQGQEIINFATTNGIPLITDLDNELDVSDFNDRIHLSNRGQKKMATRILNSIKNERK